MIKQLLLIMGVCIYSVNYCTDAPAVPERSHTEQSTIPIGLPADNTQPKQPQEKNTSKDDIKESGFCSCCCIQ